MITRIKSIATIVAILPFLSGLSVAADAPVEPPQRAPVLDKNVERIEVTGQRPEALRQLTLDFIIDIGDPLSSTNGYARWRNDLCVAVHAVADPVAAQYVADSISFVALQLGLDPGAPGCRPNLHIIFADDGREVATKMVEDSRRTFRPFRRQMDTTKSLQALETFKSAEVPVRWWHITGVFDAVGIPAFDFSDGHLKRKPVDGSTSRITNEVRDEMWNSIIIVDTSKLGGVSWPQLTDYLAMVSLAQVRSDGGPTGYSSILNLFRSDNPPPGMTEMDRTYLRALYELDTLLKPHAQRGNLATRMVSELTEED